MCQPFSAAEAPLSNAIISTAVPALAILSAERCWSGRTGLPAKQLHPQKGCRGFESPPLRHFHLTAAAYRSHCRLLNRAHCAVREESSIIQAFRRMRGSET